jgi:hypothetical protein
MGASFVDQLLDKSGAKARPTPHSAMAEGADGIDLYQ